MADRVVRFVYQADPSAVIKAGKAIEAANATMGKSAEKAAGTFAGSANTANSFANKAMLAFTLPAAAAGVAFFKLAGDANETLNKVRVLFGENADEIEAWSKTAIMAFGMTSTSALDAAANFNAFATGAGLAAQDVMSFSTLMTQLAADMASFNNTTPEEAVIALGAAFRGEFEPIRRYNVMLDVASVTQEAVRLGLIKQGDELNRTARLLATQSLVLKQTSAQQGDFARTSDSAANQQRIMVARAKEAGIAFGQILIPPVQALIRILTNGIQAFNHMSEGQKRTVISIVAFAAAVGPAIRLVTGFIGVITRLAAVARAAATVQAFLTASVGGPGALIALAAGAGAAAVFVVAMNNVIDSTTAAAKASEGSGVSAEDASSAYAGATDVTDEFSRANVDLSGKTKVTKEKLSEATKEAARFGEEIKSAFESATSASHAFESIVVPDLESTMRAWEDAVSKVEDAQRRLADAMKPATADDLASATLDVQEATIAHDKAVEKLTATLGDSEATARDLEEAQIALSRSEIRQRSENEKLQEVQRRGTALDKDVVAAKGEVRKATDELNMATVELQHAQAGITPELLLNALRAQAAGAQEWATKLQQLSFQGIDQGVLKELARLGPEGLPKVQAFFDFVNVYGTASLNGLVGGTRSALDRAIAVFPEVAPAMAAVARQMGDAAGTAGGSQMGASWINSFQNQWKAFQKKNQAFIDMLKAQGAAAGTAGKGAEEQWLNFLSSTGQQSVAGRQLGGPVRSGMSYVVGERGPELFVPGRSGTVIPAGSSTMVVVNVYNAGSVIAERDLADTVRRALIDQARRGG
jgi:hypothetical protein